MPQTISDSPRFGHADLTNCERELIHLAGSVQPHGVLLVLSVQSLVVEQATANVAGLSASLLVVSTWFCLLPSRSMATALMPSFHAST